MVLSIADIGSNRSIGDRDAVICQGCVFAPYDTHFLQTSYFVWVQWDTVTRNLYFVSRFQHLSLVYMALSINTCTLRTWDICQYYKISWQIFFTGGVKVYWFSKASLGVQEFGLNI